MDALDDLYQQVLLDHKRSPRNQHRLAHPTRQAQGHNPLCGDTVALDVELRDGAVADIGYEASGCAICVASASLMTEAVKGLPADDARRLAGALHGLLTGTQDPDEDYLGKLVALAGVRRFPSRIKCAALAWHALDECLEGRVDVGQ